jgi:hypothetical protein
VVVSNSGGTYLLPPLVAARLDCRYANCSSLSPKIEWHFLPSKSLASEWSLHMLSDILHDSVDHLSSLLVLLLPLTVTFNVSASMWGPGKEMETVGLRPLVRSLGICKHGFLRGVMQFWIPHFDMNLPD